MQPFNPPTLNIKPTPYVLVPQGLDIKDSIDLEYKIRNGVIDSHIRSQVPMSLDGWVCLEVQPDLSLLVVVEAPSASR